MNPRKLLLALLLFCGTVCFAQNEMLTTHIEKVYEQSGVKCIYSIDFPVCSDGPLKATVVNLIQNGFSEPDKQPDFQVADLKSMEESIKADADSVLSDVEMFTEGWTRIVEISKISEGKKYVCYKHLYSESDASMYPFIQTYVIRKTDGKIIDVLNKGSLEGFFKLLSKKFKSYLYENYGQDNGTYLAECVKERPEIVDFNSEELDYCWIDDNYLYLGYGQSSLAHVHGIESLRVPLRDAKPYMTNEVRKLLK